MDLENVATELYALPPSEFTAARTRFVRQARTGGQRDLAAQIQHLAKPAVAAWAVNQLVRHNRDDVDILFDLGREMRAGLTGMSGDDVRQLTRRRHQLVARLVDTARRLATASGQRLTDATAQGVRATLEATLADQASADLVAAGRLTDPLQPTGFGSTPTIGAPTSVPVKEARVTDLEEHRKRKDEAVAEARARFDEAAAAAADANRLRDRAESRVQQTMTKRSELLTRIAELRAKLEGATGRLTDLDSTLRERRSAKDEASRAARQAEFARADAERQLNRLT